MRDDLSLSINEIFHSIQGEAKNSGKPTVFIRTTGCPFRCSYCDTEYAFNEGKKIDIRKILSQVKSYNTKYVTVTGGEPLAQKNIVYLLNALCEDSFNTSLETSGLMDISLVPNDVEIVMDVKTPSSGEAEKNLKKNLTLIKKKDVLKFVIGNKEDYLWSKSILLENNLLKFNNIFFSPVHDNLNPSEIADWILKDRLNVTFQLQLHKYIWGNARGK
ncbi:MAG: radical SAM protein [Gammaproteobacteria bacterium]|tara:strand:- start:8602 stop:9252 length:651 start_codon:yes stop_codon:yes gene_type:complete